MENFYLSALAGELRQQLIGRNIGKPLLSGTQMLLDLRLPEGRALYASLNRTHPALFLSSRSLKQFASEANSASAFAAHLRKVVAGAEVISITKPPLDRVVHLELEKYDLSGDRERARLVLALTGRSANAYLFDSKKRLVAMLDERGDVPDEAWLNIEEADFDPATLGRELNETMSQAEIEERFFVNATRFGPQLRNEFVARCRYAAPAAAMRSLLNDLFARAPQPLVYSRLPFAESENHLINLKSDLLLSH